MQELTGTVFNIQRYSIDDGPGVRSTVFLKGCPLSCLWCSNPESQRPEPELSWRYTSCKRCGVCISVCPEHALSFAEADSGDGSEGGGPGGPGAGSDLGTGSTAQPGGGNADTDSDSGGTGNGAGNGTGNGTDSGGGTGNGGDLLVDSAACKRCGKCVEACLQEALSISGKQMTVDEVLKVVKRDYDYYEASGGGVTASGGEILMQADFTAELFRRCKSEGIGTCADTSGFGDPAALKKILEYADIVLYDLKHIDDSEHIRACGLSNKIILSNLELAFNSGSQVIVRVPLIPQYNTSDESLRAIAEAVREMANGSLVNIMPYHRYGASKYKMVGRKYELDELCELTQPEKDRAKEIFESFGSKCEISK